MKTVTALCPGLKHPDRIRTIKLRKYLATTAQVKQKTKIFIIPFICPLAMKQPLTFTQEIKYYQT